MSSIIQTVSYKESESKSFEDKLKEHLGVHQIDVYLSEGICCRGILTEIGKDYICLIQDKLDLIIPRNNIKYISYLN